MRKIRLALKFMTSRTGQKIIEIHKLSKLARDKGNQKMKFGQLINIMREILFFKMNAENEARISKPHFLKRLHIR